MLSATRATKSVDILAVKTQSEIQKGYTLYIYTLSIFRFTTGRNSTKELHRQVVFFYMAYSATSFNIGD